MMSATFHILVLSAVFMVGFSETSCEKFSDHPAVARLRDYIQIDTSKEEQVGKFMFFYQTISLIFYTSGFTHTLMKKF